MRSPVPLDGPAPFPAGPAGTLEQPTPSAKPSPSPKRTLKEGFTIRGPVFVLFAPTGWSGDEIVERDGSVWRASIARGKKAKMMITVSRDQGKSHGSAQSWVKNQVSCDSPKPIEGVRIAGNKAAAAECVGEGKTTRGYAFVHGGRLFTLKFKSTGPIDEEEVDWILERLRLA